MFVVEKDGNRQKVTSEIQKSAFLNSGWNLVEEKKGNEPKGSDVTSEPGAIKDNSKPKK